MNIVIIIASMLILINKTLQLIYILIIIIYTFFFFKFTIYDYKDEILFDNIYSNTRKRLHILEKNTNICLKNNSFYYCMESDYDVYSSLFSKEYYYIHRFNKSILNKFNYQNRVLLNPYINKDYDIIIGIPVSYHHLSRRIAIRETYGKLERIDKMTVKLYFILCFTLDNNENFPFSFLEIENRIYNDIIIFNLTNSYKLLVLQMLLFYQYIVNTHKIFKFFIRLDSDVYFNPYFLHKHIKWYCDVVGDKGYSYVPYVGGPFQIINKSTLLKLNEGAHSTIPIIETEDLYTGIVLSKYNITFCYVKKGYDYMHLKKENSKYIFKRNFTIIHKITSSALLLLYKYYVK